MFVMHAQEALLAAGNAVPTTTAPWWGTALGAGIGAAGAGLVTSIVAVLNNRANRKQLQAQLAAQEAMLDKQLSAQREQHAAQLAAQLKQHTEQLQAQQHDNVTALNAQAERSRLDTEAQWQRDIQQRHAEHRKWRLEGQQKAYLDFVIAAEKVRDTVAVLGEILSGSFPLPTPLAPAELTRLSHVHQQMRSLYDTAFQQAQVVRLVGPPEVAAHARSLTLAMNEYINYSDERIRTARANMPSELLREWQTSVRRMENDLEKFLEAAYLVVDAAPSPPHSVPSQPAGTAHSNGTPAGPGQLPVSGGN